ALCALASRATSAHTLVTLPDTSQGTTLTAIDSDHYRRTLHSFPTRRSSDLAANTAASAASVTISNIVLATASKQLKLSIQASAAYLAHTFELASPGPAAYVPWNATTWTNGAGSSGTLSSGAYNQVALATADV